MMGFYPQLSAFHAAARALKIAKGPPSGEPFVSSQLQSKIGYLALRRVLFLARVPAFDFGFDLAALPLPGIPRGM